MELEEREVETAGWGQMRYLLVQRETASSLGAADIVDSEVGGNQLKCAKLTDLDYYNVIVVQRKPSHS